MKERKNMANIQQLLNDEIRRLARKEVITLEKELKAQLVELRRTVAEQNKRIKTLEKAALSAVPQAPCAERWGRRGREGRSLLSRAFRQGRCKT